GSSLRSIISRPGSRTAGSCVPPWKRSPARAPPRGTGTGESWSESTTPPTSSGPCARASSPPKPPRSIGAGCSSCGRSWSPTRRIGWSRAVRYGYRICRTGPEIGRHSGGRTKDGPRPREKRGRGPQRANSAISGRLDYLRRPGYRRPVEYRWLLEHRRVPGYPRLLEASGRQQATVDAHGFAGDPLRLLRGQERDQPGHILRRTEPLHRIDLRRGLLVGRVQRIRETGFHHPGRDRVDPDLRAELPGEFVGEPDQRRLGGAVGGDHPGGAQARDAGHVHHRAAVFAHPRLVRLLDIAQGGD